MLISFWQLNWVFISCKCTWFFFYVTGLLTKQYWTMAELVLKLFSPSDLKSSFLLLQSVCGCFYLMVGWSADATSVKLVILEYKCPPPQPLSLSFFRQPSNSASHSKPLQICVLQTLLHFRYSWLALTDNTPQFNFPGIKGDLLVFELDVLVGGICGGTFFFPPLYLAQEVWEMSFLHP